MVAMPPWPSSSTRRYRPPSVSPMSVTGAVLQVERPQVLSERRCEVGSLERHLDRRLQPAERRARVVAGALELVRVHGLLRHERLDGIRQLDLAAGAALGLLELVEDLRRQDVPTDDGERRRR